MKPTSFRLSKPWIKPDDKECKLDSMFGCVECKQVKDKCTKCAKDKLYELLKTGLSFADITRQTSHVIGFDAN